MTPIYLDHAATTPVRPEVLAAMEPFANERFGNPSSSHRWGREAASALEDARAELATALGARPAEIRFVRGGTESDNLAILGTARAASGRSPVTVVSAIEHSAVLEAAGHLVKTGESEQVLLDVAPDGSLDLERLKASIRDRTATVSVMWVNNETGLVLPVDEVVRIGHAAGALVHTDASQAVGKVPIDLRRTPVDLLTGTGHKIYGPRGMGFLFVREGTPLAPLLHGGGQERALRPGTEDVAGAVGLATAVRLAVAEQASSADRLVALRERFEQGLTEALGDIRINCAEGPRAAHVSSVGLPDVPDGPALLMALDLEGIAVSGGSACHSGAGKSSHVIAALYGDDDAFATVRYSFGRTTTEDHVDRAISATALVTARVRAAA